MSPLCLSMSHNPRYHIEHQVDLMHVTANISPLSVNAAPGQPGNEEWRLQFEAVFLGSEYISDPAALQQQIVKSVVFHSF